MTKQIFVDRNSGLEKVSVRINQNNPNHHLWWNRGTWWLHATVHCGDFTKRRVRIGLQTKDVEIARKKRDSLFLDQKEEEVR